MKYSSDSGEYVAQALDCYQGFEIKVNQLMLAYSPLRLPL